MMRDVATGRQKAQGVGCVETLLAGLREHRLTAYRAMPADVREHYSLEAEIAQNYRGRFAYELLQNADDAMGENGLNDSVAIVLTNDCLLVANTGRPINEDDVRSLCGVSVSTKGVAGRKRASIGHKGMGFKSVLELTDRPSIFSRELSFRFDRTASADLLREEFGGDLLRGQNRAPAMRLPFPAEKIPQRVQQLLDDGMNTVFQFPLDSAKTAQDVARALERMDAKAILFLRRLEKVDIRNELGQTKRASWSLTRELWKEGQGWVPVGELPGAGMVRVHIADETGEQSFAVFSESDIEIQDHRGGIEGASWRDVELTEVSVAMPVDERTDYLQPNSRDPRFHVFLATGERVPFPILINGAFNCDLSRQSIRCGEDPRNYNRFLVEQAGRLLCNRVVQYARSSGQPVSEMLALFDRSSVVDEDGEPVQPETSAARILISAVRKTLHGNPFIPTGDGEQAPIESIAVFPPFSRDRELGMTIRRQLGDKRVSTRSGRLPAAEVCDAASGEVLGDLGASVLSYSELPKLLERMTPEARITQTRGNGLSTDRTLDLVTRVWWELLADEDKQSFRDAVRERRLFPVGSTRYDGTLNHIRTKGLGCFFPPRSLKGEVPLEGLCFLSRDVCWGTLPPKQRNELLHDEMVAWQAIWDIREFKFPEVMRSAVLPLLRLDRTKEATEPLRRYDVLAALCQLAGRAPDKNSPLPYERIGSNRALHGLARLPVPCQTEDGGEYWVPAYRAYFGRDWVGEASVETLFEEIDSQSVGDLPSLHILVKPERFVGLLDQLRHVSTDSEEQMEDVEEASEDEDDEAALVDRERDQWLEFFAWLGVNTSLRPVSFQDVEEARGGWLKTRGLSRPQGGWCQRLPEEKWSAYVDSLHKELAENEKADGAKKHFVRLHDLEHLHTLQRWIAEGQAPGMAESLFRHLALNWKQLSRIARARLALVPADRVPARRSPPPRPWSDELFDVGHDFWLWRLRSYPWCPTVHGPRRPNDAWIPSSEAKRRFQPARMKEVDQFLIPTLPSRVAKSLSGRRSMADALGIRQELSQGTFRPSDAATVCRRLSKLFDGEEGQLDRSDLRDVIRPTYRHMFELMPTTRGDNGWTDARQLLADIPILEHDGEGGYRFSPASQVTHAARRDTRARLGSSQTVWTFILEGERVAQARLPQFFGSRSLEDTVNWSFTAGESALPTEGLKSFRHQLFRQAAYLLCMLEVDRSGSEQVQRDISRMRDFIERVEPIESLLVSFSLPSGGDNGTPKQRTHFVSKDRTTVLLLWDEVPWSVPLGDKKATALSMALCEYLEVNQVLQFAALLNASSDEAREHILRAAGAPYGKEREDKLVVLRRESPVPKNSETQVPKLNVEQTLPDLRDEEHQPLDSHVDVEEIEEEPTVLVYPLYSPDELFIEGEPVTIQCPPDEDSPGSTPKGPQPPPTHKGNSSSPSNKHTHRTDRDAQDIVGMQVALRFEAIRVMREAIGDESESGYFRQAVQPVQRVFDVSSPAEIARARDSSSTFCQAFDDLVSRYGLNRHFPGFDILTLGPVGEVERCIELKSSGVAARVQEMTWNEWKVSSSGELAERFYLYLVGNLRADIPGALPFVRTIRNPVAQLRSAVVTAESRVQQRVQLRVDRFDEAEEVVLRVGEFCPRGS